MEVKNILVSLKNIKNSEGILQSILICQIIYYFFGSSCNVLANHLAYGYIKEEVKHESNII